MSDKYDIDAMADDLDRAYFDGQEDMGRQVIEFLHQLYEEGISFEEAIERVEELVEDTLSAQQEEEVDVEPSIDDLIAALEAELLEAA